MNIKDIPVYRSSDLATTNYRMDSYSRQSKGNDPQLAKIMPGCYIPISDYERVTQEELHLLRVYIAADAARRRNTPARKRGRPLPVACVCRRVRRAAPRATHGWPYAQPSAGN